MQYSHLEETFKPYLTQNSPSTRNLDITHLSNHSLLFSSYPTHHQLYALIIACSPISQISNQMMTKNLDSRCLTILRKLHNLPKNTYSKKQHITKFLFDKTKPIIITQAYAHNNEKFVKREPITITNLKKQSTPPVLVEILRADQQKINIKALVAVVT